MQGTVKYSEEFVTPTGLKKWVGIEMPFEDTIHSPVDKLEEAMSRVHRFVAKVGITSLDTIPAYYTEQPISSIQVEKEWAEEERMKVLIQDINNETVLRRPDGTGGLMAWAVFVNGQAEKCPALKEAFDKKHSELNAKSI